MNTEGRKRIVIENITPCIDCGRFPIKRVVGEIVKVGADILCDGHDDLNAVLLYKEKQSNEWNPSPMRFIGNDRWEGMFFVSQIGSFIYTVQGWVDHFSTWQERLKKKFHASQDITSDLLLGAHLIESSIKRVPLEFVPVLENTASVLASSQDPQKRFLAAIDDEITTILKAYPDKSLSTISDLQLTVVVDRKKAIFSSWYELFPRSTSALLGKHGTFRDCIEKLPFIAELGFDVLYLPPIHPIGVTSRKGKNNSVESREDDPGCPWAIGSSDGGHKSIEPALGTMEDFELLVEKASSVGLEISIDIAFQCSPDHPYVKEHPEWFNRRPDGTIQFAENPPKKYEDIVPFNFESPQWNELWDELKSVIEFWIKKGVKIFRVDNPHTKPFPFWEWLISEIRLQYPEVLFLSEAFTRPKIMKRLAKVGFDQSYTYFTWRNTKQEMTEYLEEITQSEVAEYFRPNFWPNTPDILPEHLQFGGEKEFIIRLVLAATLSSNYGIYGPPFDMVINGALPGREEYLDSEKYEIKYWDWNSAIGIRKLIKTINQIRQNNPALQLTRNLKFYDVDDDNLLFYGKATPDLSNVFLVVVNLDPFHAHTGLLKVPLEELGIENTQTYLLHDLLFEQKYVWHGSENRITLDPAVTPALVCKVHRKLRREVDFDYY